MRRSGAVFFVALLALSGWGVSANRVRAGETDGGKGTRVALDLMDLDIPGNGGGGEMDLPPIQGTEKREPEPVAPAPSRKPAEPEGSRSEIRPAGGPPPASHGLAPFLLDEPQPGEGKARSAVEPSGDRAHDSPTDELPAELKPVPMPPSRTENLKLPEGTDAGGSARSSVPEMPLLKEEDGGPRLPAASGSDSSLTMKPLPELRGTSTAGRSGGPSSKDLRAEDTLQVHEAVDAKLLDLFKRYYKDR